MTGNAKRRKERLPGGAAVTVITLDRCSKAMYSAVQATEVNSSRSIKQSSNQAIKQSSNQARKRFYHRGARENDRVHGEASILALRARIRSNFARSATTCLLCGLDRSPLFLCDKNICLIT
jgi:hypothetical protein